MESPTQTSTSPSSSTPTVAMAYTTHFPWSRRDVHRASYLVHGRLPNDIVTRIETVVRHLHDELRYRYLQAPEKFTLVFLVHFALLEHVDWTRVNHSGIQKFIGNEMQGLSVSHEVIGTTISRKAYATCFDGLRLSLYQTRVKTCLSAFQLHAERRGGGLRLNGKALRLVWTAVRMLIEREPEMMHRLRWDAIFALTITWARMRVFGVKNMMAKEVRSVISLDGSEIAKDDRVRLWRRLGEISWNGRVRNSYAEDVWALGMDRFRSWERLRSNRSSARLGGGCSDEMRRYGW